MATKKVRAGYCLRPDGRYQRQFQLNGKRYTVYGKSYKECDKKEDLIRLSQQSNSLVPRDIILDSYFEMFQKKREGEVKAITSYIAGINYNNHISPLLGEKNLSEIKRSDIINLRNCLLNKKLKPSSVNTIMALVHCLFREAVIDERITANPCDNIRCVSLREQVEARDTIHRALSDEELKVFFDCIKKSRYFCLFKLMLQTGIRAGEACGLRWSDIDYENNVIHISRTATSLGGKSVVNSPKTKGSKRDIPLNNAIKAVLAEQRKKSDVINLDGWIFTSKEGKMITTNNIVNLMVGVNKRMEKEGIGVEPFGSHALRDTFATRAVEAGMKPETLQRILGHSNITLTMDLYYHLSEEKKQEEMQMISISI